MSDSERIRRLDAGLYELSRSMHEANVIADDRRQTTYRRRLAGQESAVLFAMLLLGRGVRAIDNRLEAGENTAETLLAAGVESTGFSRAGVEAELDDIEHGPERTST